MVMGQTTLDFRDAVTGQKYIYKFAVVTGLHRSKIILGYNFIVQKKITILGGHIWQRNSTNPNTYPTTLHANNDITISQGNVT